MKRYFYTLLAAVLLAVGMPTGASAKRVVAPDMYMFGFAASFNDTIVYFTDIQRVDSAWVDNKNNFLQSRDIYSNQLRDFLAAEKKLPYRTCLVVYDKNRAKLEKKLVKMRRLYGKDKAGVEHFDVRELAIGEFRFKAIDLTELEDAEGEQTVADKNAGKKAKPRKARFNAPNHSDKFDIGKEIGKKIEKKIEDAVKKKRQEEVEQREKEKEEYKRNHKQ